MHAYIIPPKVGIFSRDITTLENTPTPPLCGVTFQFITVFLSWSSSKLVCTVSSSSLDNKLSKAFSWEQLISWTRITQCSLKRLSRWATNEPSVAKPRARVHQFMINCVLIQSRNQISFFFLKQWCSLYSAVGTCTSMVEPTWTHACRISLFPLYYRDLKWFRSTEPPWTHVNVRSRKALGWHWGSGTSLSRNPYDHYFPCNKITSGLLRLRYNWNVES